AILAKYAYFLSINRNDYPKAAYFYKMAMEFNPTSGIISNYATFLKNHLKDYKLSEELFRASLEMRPDHANTLGNYAGLLLVIGNSNEGMSLLKKAMELSDNDVLLLECYFYHMHMIKMTQLERKVFWR